eukprot:TRINITY_DN43275_c0_g1_i1.p1 TRINITY_DN43275_c0_g1~~TRINITY_DN43275_c0_g1_i1.p1  ORF type:complete len:248 (+),score=38.00 TRINITY_DN43275_c0_g1_i1:86-829(+)
MSMLAESGGEVAASHREHAVRPPPLAIKESCGSELKEPASENLATYFAVYLENPDGSLCLGIPPDLKLPSPPVSPRLPSRLPDVSTMLSSIDRVSPGSFAGNILCSIQRHERLFTGLLVLEFVVEMIYLMMLYHGARHSIREVAAVYQAVPVSSLWILFWVQLGCELSYLKLYFGMALTAVMKHKPRMYSWFANIALGGIVVQVLFSYMNRANIVVFALRLFCYVYARFMRSMLQQIMLRPPPAIAV